MSSKEGKTQPAELPVTERPPVNKITPEALRQNAEQDEQAKKNVEKLVQSEVEARLDWDPQLREYMAKYLREHEGQWRECDGDYVKFVGFFPNSDKRIIEAVFDAFGQDVADDIPMPEWM